jgi:hypothetical protein
LRHVRIPQPVAPSGSRWPAYAKLTANELEQVTSGMSCNNAITAAVYGSLAEFGDVPAFVELGGVSVAG